VLVHAQHTGVLCEKALWRAVYTKHRRVLGL